MQWHWPAGPRARRDPRRSGGQARCCSSRTACRRARARRPPRRRCRPSSATCRSTPWRSVRRRDSSRSSRRSPAYAPARPARSGAARDNADAGSPDIGDRVHRIVASIVCAAAEGLRAVPRLHDVLAKNRQSRLARGGHRPRVHPRRCGGVGPRGRQARVTSPAAGPSALAGGICVPVSMTLDHLDFGSPSRLVVLLIVPLVLALILVLARRRSRGNVRFTNLDILALTARRGTHWTRLVPLLLLALAFAAAVCAFAQPRVPDAATDRSTTILLLADVSGSMQATDVRPSRLVAAITAMRDFLAAVPQDDRVGLMTFSDASEVLATPTTDRFRVESNLRLLEPQGGTALGAAVTGAVRVLVTSLAGAGVQRRPGKPLPAAIVVESDGAQDRGTVTPLEGADAAKAAGIPIYSVSLGTRHGFVTEGEGPLSRSVRVLPDPGVMALLARETGGSPSTPGRLRGSIDLSASLRLGIDRHSAHEDVSPWFEAAAAVLLAAAVGVGIALGPALP